MKKATSVFIFMLVFLSFCHSKEFSNKILQQYRESYKYERITNYVDAIRVLLPIYKDYPNAYLINMRLGWLSYRMSKFRDAEIYYKKAEVKMPGSLELKNKLTQVYLAREEWGKSEIRCNAVLTSDYYNYYANLYLVVTYLAQKKYAEAEKIDRKMLYLYPADVLFLTNLGMTLNFQNKKLEASSVFRYIQVLDPENITAGNFIEKQKLIKK
ncbi:hypothetical protein KAJ27_09850 [bacterium]|nr:hypothetical protein [bacterium]